MTEPRRVLFVCTGNLCRSPMAVALAASRHGSGGVLFESAGVNAVVDAPATPTAVAACRELGVEVGDHRARQLDSDLAEAADRIFVMTEAHLAAVLEIAPGVADRVALLRPDGTDVEDPFGSPLETYRATRDEIVAALDARRDEFPGPG